MAVINISIPDEFLAKVDEYKKIVKEKRSEFFINAAELYFKKIEEKMYFERRKKRVYIFDSSVVIKWFAKIDESNLIEANRLYEKVLTREYNVLSPELLIYEVINVVGYKTNVPDTEINNIVKNLFELLIVIRLDSDIFLEAYRISQNTNSSVYDSIYLAVSKKYNTVLITADEKLYRGAVPFNFNIKLLNDFISEKDEF